MADTVATDESLRAAVRASFPSLTDELARLVAIPSVSSFGFPEPRAPSLEAFAVIRDLFTGAGVERLQALDLPGAAPVLTGEIPGPKGAPSVLLYGHYDVVPAGAVETWSSPPFAATAREGAIYGRGTADSKCHV